MKNYCTASIVVVFLLATFFVGDIKRSQVIAKQQIPVGEEKSVFLDGVETIIIFPMMHMLPNLVINKEFKKYTSFSTLDSKLNNYFIENFKFAKEIDVKSLNKVDNSEFEREFNNQKTIFIRLVYQVKKIDIDNRKYYIGAVYPLVYRPISIELSDSRVTGFYKKFTILQSPEIFFVPIEGGNTDDEKAFNALLESSEKKLDNVLHWLNKEMI